MVERHCIITGEKIDECFGYVLARDFISYSNGERSDVREISARSMIIVDNLEECGVNKPQFLEGLLE